MSNNGISFVEGSSEIWELINHLDEKKMKTSTANRRIKCHFNPPYVLHFGGVHETLIKSENKAIHGILESGDIRDEKQATACSRVEELVNL